MSFWTPLSNLHRQPADIAATTLELVGRAESLVPLLREYASEAERLQRIPQVTFERLRDNGLFRFNQPKRWGGYELPPQSQFAICSTLARGCPSSAWVVSNLGGHNAQLAAWPEAAQQDVWGESGQALIASSYIFSNASAEASGDGYRLSGQWPFSSGIDVSGWTIVGANTRTESGSERRFFLLPRGDYEILETWNVVGLGGTGSKDLRASDIFVPAYRSLSVAELEGCRGPGLRENANPIYRLPTVALGPFNLMGIIYGAACGAFEEFKAWVLAKSAIVSGQRLADLPTIQIKLSEAASCLQAVGLLAAHHQETFWLDAVAGKEFDQERILSCKRDAAYAARLCVSVSEIIMAAVGGSGLQTSSSIQRYWRDIHAGAAQFGLNWDFSAQLYGKAALAADGTRP